MFIDKKFILIDELADKLNVRLPYICTVAAKAKDYNESSIVKIGYNSFIHQDVANQFFKKIDLNKIEFNDFSQMVPLPYLEKEFRFNKLYCLKKNYGEIKIFHFNTMKNENKLIEKVYFKFNNEIFNKIKNKVYSHEKFKNLEPDDKYIQVSKHDCIVYW